MAAHLNCKNDLPDNGKILYCYVITLMSQIITTGILVTLHCKSLSQQTVRFTCGSLKTFILLSIQKPSTVMVCGLMVMPAI